MSTDSYVIINGVINSFGSIQKLGLPVYFTTPTLTTPLVSQQFQKVFSGLQISLALTTYTNQLWMWGRNGENQMTYLDTSDRVIPQINANLSNYNFSSVSANDLYNTFDIFAIVGSEFHQLIGWGSNTYLWSTRNCKFPTIT